MRDASGIAQGADEEAGRAGDTRPGLHRQRQSVPVLQGSDKAGESAIDHAMADRQALLVQRQNACLAAWISDGGDPLHLQIAIDAQIKKQDAVASVGNFCDFFRESKRKRTNAVDRHPENKRVQLIRRHGKISSQENLDCNRSSRIVHSHRAPLARHLSIARMDAALKISPSPLSRYVLPR